MYVCLSWFYLFVFVSSPKSGERTSIVLHCHDHHLPPSTTSSVLPVLTSNRLRHDFIVNYTKIEIRLTAFSILVSINNKTMSGLNHHHRCLCLTAACVLELSVEKEEGISVQ